MSQLDRLALGAQFLRFASVGAMGFVIDLMATLALAPALGPDLGRIVAILIAVAVTFALNRTHTFGARNSPVLKQAGRYLLVSGAGAGVNYVGYIACLAIIGYSGHDVAQNSGLAIAVAFGSALAMGFNFLGARFFAFAK